MNTRDVPRILTSTGPRIFFVEDFMIRNKNIKIISKIVKESIRKSRNYLPPNYFSASLFT